MDTLTRISLAMGIAVVLGLGSTDILLRSVNPLGTNPVQGWVAWPSTGLGTDSRAANPYLQAHIARTGLIPLGSSEGILLRTQFDSGGNQLRRNCDYRIRGQLPRSQLWTLTPTDMAGGVLPNPAERYAISSDQLLRRQDGTFDIILSRRVQPGNWLPLGPYRVELDGFTGEPLPRDSIAQDQGFVLSLRLYGASLSAESPFAQINLPSIQVIGCRK